MFVAVQTASLLVAEEPTVDGHGGITGCHDADVIILPAQLPRIRAVSEPWPVPVQEDCLVAKNQRCPQQ